MSHRFRFEFALATVLSPESLCLFQFRTFRTSSGVVYPYVRLMSSPAVVCYGVLLALRDLCPTFAKSFMQRFASSTEIQACDRSRSNLDPVRSWICSICVDADLTTT